MHFRKNLSKLRAVVTEEMETKEGSGLKSVISILVQLRPYFCEITGLRLIWVKWPWLHWYHTYLQADLRFSYQWDMSNICLISLVKYITYIIQNENLMQRNKFIQSQIEQEHEMLDSQDSHKVRVCGGVIVRNNHVRWRKVAILVGEIPKELASGQGNLFCYSLYRNKPLFLGWVVGMIMAVPAKTAK